MSKEWGPADTAREQVERWDAGQSIWTLEMGGMGPGYEQAIQVLAIEITRDNLDKFVPANEAEYRTFGDSTITRIDVKLPDGSYSCGGFSGAQAGAAKSLALQWLREGPAALLARPEAKDRKIQASKSWPRVPEVA
jgi:hypothetical protein